MKSTQDPCNTYFFGRDRDLEQLMDRAGVRGVTVLTGQPQIGKSTLLAELITHKGCNFPSSEPSEPSRRLHTNEALFGLAHQTGETPDLLPRAIQNLYQRWLGDSTYLQQARTVFAQQRTDLVTNLGKAVGAILKANGDALHSPIGGDLVKSLFESLAIVNQDLKSGRSQLPSLPLDDSRELLEIVYRITEKPSVLILDQWDQSPDLTKESRVLEAFIRHYDEWPPCHIFVACRLDETSRIILEELRDGFPQIVKIQEIGEMNLEDETLKGDLLSALHTNVPITRGVDPTVLLNLIAGNPAVLDRWLNSAEGQGSQSLDQLVSLANQAHRYAFPEFRRTLRDRILTDDERALAIRLLLLPATSDPDVWDTLRSLALGDAGGKLLDSLHRKGILRIGVPPSWGHAKRREAAFLSFLDNCSEEFSELSALIINNLAKRIRDLRPSESIYISSLAWVRGLPETLHLSAVSEALCECAHSLGIDNRFGSSTILNPPIDAFEVFTLPLLSMGLTNITALEYADLDDQRQALNRLRLIYRGNVELEPHRKQFASGLFNLHLAVNKESNESSEAASLLSELTGLAQEWPGDRWIIARLAATLVSAAARTEKPQDQDVLLDRLRQLNIGNPGEANLREDLARALSNAIWDVIFDHPYLELVSRSRGTVTRRNALFEELQTLQQRHPNDSYLREKLASTISSILLAPMGGDQTAWREGLLRALGDLCLQPDSSGELAKIWTRTVRSSAWLDDAFFSREIKDKLATRAAGVEGSNSKVKAYWSPGKTGMD